MFWRLEAFDRRGQSRGRVPGFAQPILIRYAGHPATALREQEWFCGTETATAPAGRGVADGVNKNWLNGIGDPSPGCAHGVPK